MGGAKESIFDRIGGWGTIIAIAFGLAGLAAGHYWYRQGKRLKTLDWIPLSVASIVRSPVHDVSKGLQLTWNGTPLSTPYSVAVRIQNTGNEAILDTDFATPLTVDFGKSTCFEARI